MGQSESVPPPHTPRSARSDSKSWELLTPRQKLALQKSWKKSPKTGIDNIGSQIFMKIYMRDRSVGNMFGLHNVPLQNLKYHKFFQLHAMTFTRSLDFIIHNLDNMAKIRQFCRRLGKTHVGFIERGFKPEYWDIFAESLTECAIDWEGGQRCKDVLIGWRTLINFVIEEMRLSFVKEKRSRSIVSCPRGSIASGNPDETGSRSSGSVHHSNNDLLIPSSWEQYQIYNEKQLEIPRRRTASLQPQRLC
ncbi:hypothetical protein FO519_000053 [Halicephalobus sp. NKZ332]|nr:hypothetical protein FO519_000053 [Halicephalobus sp. NKZ332]